MCGFHTQNFRKTSNYNDKLIRKHEEFFLNPFRDIFGAEIS
jgi:hypothetical protein